MVLRLACLSRHLVRIINARCLVALIFSFLKVFDTKVGEYDSDQNEDVGCADMIVN